MADDSRKPVSNIGTNGFIWLLLVAAGTIFVANKLPLEASRPPGTDKVLPGQHGVQDIDARLWQDPFATVAELLAKSPELKPENCPANEKAESYRDSPNSHKEADGHCYSPLRNAAAGPLLVLVASVSGAPYSQEQEFRRRTRYAVLAGLNTEGYVPQDSEHIGFFWPEAAALAHPAAPPLQAVASNDRAPASAQAGLTVKLPKVVPFEWFNFKSGSPPRRVLLLWFDEDALHADTDPPRPLRQFQELLCRSLASATPQSSAPWTKAAILGPQLSTTLRDMAMEVDRSTDKDPQHGICPAAAAPQFYVYSATADDAAVIPGYPKRSSCNVPETALTDFFENKKDVKLYRMIATDEALACTIRRELELRQVKFENGRHSQIAVVSEWDTLYGQALPESMARRFGAEGCQQLGSDPAEKSWLHCFKYLRGLDGQMPNTDRLLSGSGTKVTGGKQDKDSKDNAKSRPDAKPQDRAEGQGQFDYLSRLGDSMRDLDAHLREDSPRGINPRGIEAVGILGSDLYDKLLVLQALRPLLPDAVFFTTDLDALILHPIALTSTRNLLVASSFGLRLRPAVQGEIPPFRSSYQTAGFLAARVAIRRDGAPPTGLMPRQPLLFEIGRSDVFQFPTGGQSLQTQRVTEDGRSDSKDCKEDLLRCQDIQPLASAMFPQMSLASAIAFTGLGLCLAVACTPVRRRIWDRIDGFMRRGRSPALLAARGLALLLAAGVGLYLVAEGIHLFWPRLAHALTQSESGNGQPMVLLDGISVWPTIFLRAATLALCIVLIIHGYLMLNKNIEKIAKDLHLVKTRETIKTQQDRIIRKSPPWIRFTSQFWFRLPDDDAVHQAGEHLPQEIFRFWRMYIHQGHWVARSFRVLAATLAMVLLGLLLFFVFGAPPIPARGAASWWAYVVVTAALVFATLFLIAFVADSTLLTWRVVKALREETSIWPAQTVREVGARLGLPPEALDDWIDLLFVSKRTKCHTVLIYFPFLIIALLIVSYSRLFANYGVIIPDIVTIGVAVLVVAACAVALRSSAEASRAKARRRISDALIVARKAKDGRLADQLELLLARIEELREGAFTPMSQQPVVRAMLLPIGSFGGTALLEYLLLPGLS
jgi:hypothetical protein